MTRPQPLFKKIIIWSLVVACYLSFGSAYGRTVICSDYQGGITLEMLHSGAVQHCLTGHLRGQHQNAPARENKIVAPSENNCCANCDDFEVLLQLFAPRNEPAKTIINYIAKPLFTTVESRHLLLPPPVSSPQLPASPSDPSFTHLKSTILLI